MTASTETAEGGPVSAFQGGQVYAWFVVFALAFTNCISYVERQLLTLLFGPIKADFHLTDTQVSLLAGMAFIMSYVFFGLIVGRLADSKNRKWIIMMGAFVWSIATIACGAVKNFTQIFAARAFVGIGEAVLNPCSISIISDYFPRDRLARALSVYGGSQYLGSGIALIVGGFVIKLATDMGTQVLPILGTVHPWQLTFLFVGVGGMTILIPLFFVKEPRRRNLIQLKSEEVATAQKPKGVPFRDLWGFIYANRMTYGVYYTAFPLAGMIGFGTITWMPSYFIRVHGWSIHTVGLLYGIVVGIIGMAGIVCGAFLLEHLVKRGYKNAYAWLPLYTMPCNLVIQTAVPFMPTAELAFAMSALSMFVFSLPSMASATMLQLITPNQMRGQLVSYGLVVSSIVSIALGPTVTALITDYLFQSEMEVGYSLSTLVAIITPISWILVLAGQKAFKHSLEQANVWANATK